MNTELQIKATITDIESKLDKNDQPYFRISLQRSPNYFYAFSFSLKASTLSALTDTPHQFINQQVLITYEELPNKDNQGTFTKVKEIEILY